MHQRGRRAPRSRVAASACRERQGRRPIALLQALPATRFSQDGDVACTTGAQFRQRFCDQPQAVSVTPVFTGDAHHIELDQPLSTELAEPVTPALVIDRVDARLPDGHCAEARPGEFLVVQVDCSDHLGDSGLPLPGFFQGFDGVLDWIPRR